MLNSLVRWLESLRRWVAVLKIVYLEKGRNDNMKESSDYFMDKDKYYPDIQTEMMHTENPADVVGMRDDVDMYIVNDEDLAELTDKAVKQHGKKASVSGIVAKTALDQVAEEFKNPDSGRATLLSRYKDASTQNRTNNNLKIPALIARDAVLGANLTNKTKRVFLKTIGNITDSGKAVGSYKADINLN